MTIKKLRTQILDMYEKIDELNDRNKKEFYLISLRARDAMSNIADHKFEQISIEGRLNRIQDRLEQINWLCKEVEELDMEYSALAHKKR